MLFNVLNTIGTLSLCLVIFGQGCAQNRVADESGFQQNIAHVSSEELRRLPNVPSEIHLDLIREGGPGIDGIPSIDRPLFETVDQASAWLPDDSIGMLVSSGSSTKYYPFQILVWHEIVNDEIEGQPIMVTYCPLCKTGIVFSRIVNGSVLTFGVSGKLYENNLLMYNKNGGPTSLWSQVHGRAVVGALIGQELEILPQLHVRWGDIKRQFSASGNVQVLSRQTGFVRDYANEPYGDYYSSPKTLYPLKIRDPRLDDKTEMLALIINGHAKAYPLKEALAVAPFTDILGGKRIRIERDSELHSLIAIDDETNELLPAIESFWFAWVVAHPDTELWRAEDRE